VYRQNRNGNFNYFFEKILALQPAGKRKDILLFSLPLYFPFKNREISILNSFLYSRVQSLQKFILGFLGREPPRSDLLENSEVTSAISALGIGSVKGFPHG